MYYVGDNADMVLRSKRVKYTLY